MALQYLADVPRVDAAFSNLYASFGEPRSQSENFQVRCDIPAQETGYLREAETSPALKVPRVDAAELHARRQEFHLPFVVNLAKDVHSQFHGQIMERLEPRLVRDHARHEKHGVGLDRPGIMDLVLIHDEILPEDGLSGLAVHLPEG